ncbi:phosphate acetyltransferase [Acidihalobacter ferrooxydans]|uniref:Phosphate acetyltransferase n=1 Tax=Acidihalobacter ferrooxydans TaxID=1765967 RepID=A0A1P8UDA0_9GAMM|nr:phosphate acetyltransferase [Acidihalobacter ferrooxydans]APZ41766.1 phosphate acetyltransferase [Acidihalobacter ferrooxydans]
MFHSIYIAGAEPRSGKSMVVLGMLELLTAKMPKVGFFRPIVAQDQVSDALTDIVLQRYKSDLPPAALYGVTQDRAAKMIAHHQYEDLLKTIVEKYKAIEQTHDIVVCVGSDFSDDAAPMGLDFNVELANALGCRLLPVLRGHGRTPADTVDAVLLLEEYLEGQKCDLLALFVNRVDPAIVAAVREQLAEATVPCYVLPERSMLGKPTVGEIARTLNCNTFSGDDASLNHVVENFKIAAMPVDEFLDHLEESGSLVIVPGSRSDIVMACLACHAAVGTPSLAGLLLTGNDEPAASVMRVVQGLQVSRVPILLSPWDTFTTAMKVAEVEGGILPSDAGKIALALGTLESSVDIQQLSRLLARKSSQRKTPLMFEYELIQRAKAQRKHIVLPEGDDERILRAAEIISLRNVVGLTLLGNAQRVRQRQQQFGLQLRGVNIVDPETSPWLPEFAQTYYALRKHKGISLEMATDTVQDISYFGTLMVHLGYADGMVSGAAHTTQHTIRPAFEIIKTRPGTALVSSVFFMCLEDRVLVYGDCAVNPNPNAEQLADIAIASSDTAQRFGVEPLTAMLSYSTGESGKGADVERVREAARIAHARRPDLKIEGPIQYDAAVDAAVARSKLPGSEVAGHATVFIFPDLNTGNNTYKAVQRSANAIAIGPVLQGLNKPVNDLSRGCLVPDIVNTVVITAVQAQREA